MTAVKTVGREIDALTDLGAPSGRGLATRRAATGYALLLGGALGSAVATVVIVVRKVNTLRTEGFAYRALGLEAFAFVARLGRLTSLTTLATVSTVRVEVHAGTLRQAVHSA